MYRAGQKQKTKQRKWRKRLIFLIIFLLLCFGAYLYIKNMLKPDTKISASKGVDKTLSYENKTKHYELPNFSIDIPLSWTYQQREPGQYQTYTWKTSEKGTNGQQIQIFEDTIPLHLAVNRALIISGEGDHITLNGEISDNCINYSQGKSARYSGLVADAKWKGTSFLCDAGNTERTLVGTSSSDGINTVILRSPALNSSQHRYFFTYTSNQLDPDFTPFYNALGTFRMQ